MDLQYIVESCRTNYAGYDSDCEVKRPLRIETAANGIVLPLKVVPEGYDVGYQGGVLDENRVFVPLSASRRKRRTKALLSGYEVDGPIARRRETVIYGGVLHEFYGHVLIETLSRLWYWLRNDGRKHRVVFDCVPKAQGKFREFFELFGIPYDGDTFIDTPTQYDCVIVPEQSFVYDVSWHQDWLVPFDYLSARVEAASCEKVYFTRTKLRERNPVYGEKAIERIFRQNGFSVYSPERLSLRRQIALMKGCRQLVAVASSAPHNLLFARPGTKLVCLNRCSRANFSQNLVNQAKRLDATYVDAWLNPLPVDHSTGPWIIGFTEELSAFFRAHRMKFRGKVGRVRMQDACRFMVRWTSQNRETCFSDADVKVCQSRIWRYTTWFGLPAERIFSRLLNRLHRMMDGRIGRGDICV